MLCHCAFLSLQAAANATHGSARPFLLMIVILLLIFPAIGVTRKDQEQEREN
jgi:hypothetical protein